MKSFLLIFLLSAGILSAYNDGHRIKLKKVDRIVLDGEIDQAWNMADSASDFFQQEPFYGTPPSQKTTAKMLISHDVLYCLIVCYDHSGEIEANAGTWDDFSGDVVSVMLDTYDDKRTAYKFAVGASGVQMDCRLIDDGRNRDYNWDGVWFAKSKIYSWGYVVEMEIPLRTISYGKTLSEWGLDFDRWIPHSKEDIYWNKYEQNEGLRISKFGRLLLEDNPSVASGMNLEIYPVGLTNIQMQENGKYKVKADAGIDLFYNPSPTLTLQLTANPDFAQIEADPYDFNIGRYESYFSERRPFFTQGNEIFMASGQQRNSGFYRPLELFYSRRIGRKLTDGSQVPLVTGGKIFGRAADWEYGAFMAVTSEKDYLDDNQPNKEDRAYFGAVRLKKQIFSNSTLGMMVVDKSTRFNSAGVIDIDGAFRESNWQLSYQLAKSFGLGKSGYAFSTGLTINNKDWMLLNRGRYIDENFDINSVGYVPWKGTGEWVSLVGPNWYFEQGAVKALMLYGGFVLNYEKADNFTDHLLLMGINLNFRSNWGGEIDLTVGKSKDSDRYYNSYELTYSSWFNISPKWDANLNGGYSRTFNFSRDYLASFLRTGAYFGLKVTKNFGIGSDLNVWVERKPDGSLEDITYNARPNISVIPFNNLTLRLYVDNVYIKSSDKLESMILGFLFSYNFSPKSWIYLAYNEVQNRNEQFDDLGRSLPLRMHTTDRASVFKLKYLYYL